MGCRSDYLDPTGREQELQRAAKLLSHVYFCRGLIIPDHVVIAANTGYCCDDRPLIELCSVLTAMTTKERTKIVYDAKSKISRDLADWWEEHQEADAERLADANAERLRKQHVKTAVAKLTTEELEALYETDRNRWA